MDLAAAVGSLFGRSATGIGEVRREPLEYDAFLAGRALTRVGGTATVDGASVPWSFVEKITEGPSVASTYLYDNGVREFAAYRSGLLDDLAPGVAAPQLLAAEEREDGALVLWIEDLGPRAPLSRDEMLLAARHLGRLAGNWLGRVPEDEWLFHGWIARHMQRTAMRDGLTAVTDALDDPPIDGRTGGRLAEAQALIAEQNRYAAALATLPQTLCHHDAVAANVYERETHGRRETVLIDWESVGPGAVGADLASLLFASPRRGDVSAQLATEIMPDALAAYADGLVEMGASVDPDAVGLGLHASIALRWALVRDVVQVLRGTNVARRGSAPHETPDEALAELLALVPVILDSAAEARRLISAR